MRRVACTAFAALSFVATSTSAAAANSDGALEFVRRLYARQGSTYDDGTLGLENYAPALRKLIERDAALPPTGEVGTLDWDPVCDCQDTDGISELRIVLAQHPPAHKATAYVTFRKFTITHVTLDLDQTRGRWLIVDVHTKRTPSLVAFLRRSVSRPPAACH
jgi:hypothetical protein